MDNSRWQKPDSDAFQINNTVHIWIINYEKCLEMYNYHKKFLNQDEQIQTERFHFGIDANRYSLTRALLKLILAKILNKAPLEILFNKNEFGKPYLKDRHKLFFNVSHSGNLGLIAITDLNEIGVDVEQFRTQMTTTDIAQRFFSKKEVEIFNTLSGKDRQIGFFNCWSRKEAFIKAVGKGLSLPLNSFDVTLMPGEKSKLLEIRYENLDAGTWTLSELPVDDNYAAAFAISERHYSTKLWNACAMNFYEL